MRKRYTRLAGVLALVLGVAAPAGAVSVPAPRIIGGTTVDAATVPWTVAILHSATPNGYQAQFCGGTLIDPAWVLTAAHCVKGSTPAAVDVAWGVSDLNAVTAANRHALSQIIVDPQYSASENSSDVALLRLATPATGASTLAVNASPTFPAAAQPLDTYGWGNTMYPGTSYPNLLMGVGLVDRAGPAGTGTCGLYGGSYIGDHMVCAGVAAGGKDACDGDSGGPLVATDASNRRVLVGVTSWGNGCAQANYPGLWSRVSSYADWIDQQIHAPATPRVHVGDATVVEGDTGNRTASFTVTVSPAPRNAMTVPYSTAGLSATSGTDFVAKTGTLGFTAGQIVKTVTVAVKPDPDGELTETYRVNLGAPTGADSPVLGNAFGTGTILDDDGTAGNQLTVGDASALEGDDGTGTVTIKVPVSLTVSAGTAWTIPYATIVGTAGTRDYTAKLASLSFAGTATSRTVSISIKREWIPEGTETLTVLLGTPSIGGLSVTRAVGTLTIVDDD